jgi:tetratricopeptide (TPR) repeat protein
VIRYILSAGLWGLCLLSCSPTKTVRRSPPPVIFTEQQKLDYEHDFIEGNKFKLMGNLSDAASLLTRCTEVNPRDAAAYFALSEIYSAPAVNNREEALKNARLAVRFDPENIWYNIHLASLYVAGELVDSAITVFRDLIRLQPDNVEFQFDIATLYTETGQYRKAIAELKKIERTYGLTEEIIIARYRAYSHKGKLKATESVLREGTEKFPGEYRFYGLLAELYSSTGMEQKAQEYYKKLLDIDPENAMGYISMIEFYKDYGNDEKVLEEMRRMYEMKAIHPDLKVELYLSITADTVFARKYHPELDEMIEQLAARNPDNFRARMMNADRNLRQKHFEEAKDDMLFLTGRVATNAFLWEQLLYLQHLLQDAEGLLKSSAEALEHFENHYLFNFFHGMAASLLKKYDEAIASFGKTLECLKREKEPDREIELQAYVLLGEAYNEQKRYDQSDAVFERALLLAPNNALVLNNYSYYLSLREEKLDVAERYIRRCIAMEPDNSTYLDTYGWVLYKLGRIDEAIVMIEKAMKNGGNTNLEIVEHLCELLVVAGREDEARHICRYAIELNNEQEKTSVEEKMKSYGKQKRETQ